MRFERTKGFSATSVLAKWLKNASRRWPKTLFRRWGSTLTMTPASTAQTDFLCSDERSQLSEQHGRHIQHMRRLLMSISGLK